MTDIVRVIAERVKLTKYGENVYGGNCPLHGDKHEASLFIDVKRELFRCGVCKVNGDAARFIELLDGVPYDDAARRIEERFGSRRQYQ